MSRSRHFTKNILLSVMVAIGGLTFDAQADANELNTDRPGQDYRSFLMDKPLPEVCRQTCEQEAQCRSWTFVRPGVQNQRAKCLLKSEVPQKIPNRCCVSGIKGSTTAAHNASPDENPDSWSSPTLMLTTEQLAALAERANAGNVQSMALLGLYHSAAATAADSEPRILDQAIRWYQRAADAGDTGAMTSLGLIYQSRRGRDADALRWLQKAAKAGDVSAMRALSHSHFLGHGLEKNAAKALIWAQKAATAEPDQIMSYILAKTYLRGKVTPVDLVEGVYWLRKAADAGSVYAMRTLSDFYCYGTAVTKDTQRGFEWAQKAAAGGSSYAMFAIGGFRLHGFCAPQEGAKAKYWFEKAATAGEVEGQFGLAGVYDRGFGTDADPKTAAFWLIGALRGQSYQAAYSIMRHPWAWTQATRKELQVRLKAEGFYRGKIDGEIGPATRKAIAALSRSGAVP